MKFVDEANKKVNFWNRNYFWSFTLFYVVLNIVLFAILRRNNLLWGLAENKWPVFNGIKEVLISIGNSFTHNDWGHVLRNMLAFSISAFYIERKIGTFNFAGVVLLLSLFSSTLTSMYAGLFWCGSSVVYFAVWGYVLIDFLFSFRKSVYNKTNTIIGAIVVALKYIGSCLYNPEGGGVAISYEPVQLIYNAGHYFGFLVGIVVCLIIQIVIVQIEKKYRGKTK